MYIVTVATVVNS